jgi:mRNA-degrading endonuclease toxin of MazEF toxin-antitoxin module
MKRQPLRGEIWYVHMPTDPPGKPPRPVVIVSQDARNRHPRADSVMVAPLTGAVEREVETRIRLSPGETGLHPSSICAEDVSVVRKESLLEPRAPLRMLSNTRICQIADMVRLAMGCPPK